MVSAFGIEHDGKLAGFIVNTSVWKLFSTYLSKDMI